MKRKFKTVVFAGGGSRCVWQAGFYETLVSKDAFDLSEVAGVSAGAFFSCLALLGKMPEAMGYFREVAGQNPKNFYPENLWTDKAVFPQYRMYREGLRRLLDDAALEALKAGPEIRILLARPPVWLSPVAATLAGFAAYSFEKKLTHPVHPVLSRRLGFRPEVVTVQACRTASDLADLILQSSCTPPFVPVLMRDNRPVLDGGLVDNVPVNALKNQAGTMLVLLTRRYAQSSIPQKPGRTYVQPSETIDIDKWDYTNPDGLDKAYALGRRDGERFCEAWMGA